MVIGDSICFVGLAGEACKWIPTNTNISKACSFENSGRIHGELQSHFFFFYQS